MRVGVDFHEWDGIFQGSRSHVLGIYQQAIEQAPDLEFVFLLDGVESLRNAHPAFRRPNVSMVRMGPAHGLMRLGWVLPRLCRQHRIDVLHTQYRVPFWGRTTKVVTIHDALIETHPQFFSAGFLREARLTFRHAARHAHTVFTVSEYSRQEICRHYKVAPSKVKVTYNAVDRSRFFPGNEGADLVRGLKLQPGGYLLVVGRLEPRKNHEVLIRAWARLGPEAPPLVIVGQEDPNFPQVRRLIDDLRGQAGNRIVQFTRLGDEELPAVMRHAQVFVYPAFAEGFGMPVAEAMASGVPVVTSDTTSLPEVAGDGALLFDPTDEDALVLRLRHALSLSAPERDELIQRGLKSVARFDWGASAQVLVQGLREAGRAAGAAA